MLFLILSVITSTLLVIILKFFNRFQVDTFQAIVVNYWVCTFTGSAIEKYSTLTSVSTIQHYNWFVPAIVLGFFFIALFNLMGWTAQKIGLTAVSVANKLSLIIPVSVAILFFHEAVTITKIIAIVLALIAVVLVTYQKTEQQQAPTPLRYFLLPIILFLGSGFNDSVVNHVQKQFLPEAEKGMFVIWIFQIAAIVGTLILVVLLLLKKKQWNWKNVLAGVVLGIPNYFSMYYLVKALADSGWQSSEVFAMNNVAIVVCSSVSGIILFKERLTKLQIVGIIFACLAILLLMNPDWVTCYLDAFHSFTNLATCCKPFHRWL